MFNKKNWKFLEGIIFTTLGQIFKILRFRKQSFDENLTDLYIYCVYFMAIFSHVVLNSMLTIFYYYFDFANYYGWFPCLLSWIAVGSCLLLSMIFRLRLRWVSHAISFFLCWGFVGTVAFSDLNSLNTFYFSVVFMLGPLFVASVQGAKFKILWFIGFVVLECLVFIYHLVITLVYRKTYKVTYVHVVLIISFQFMSIATVTNYVFPFIFQLGYKLDSFTTNVESICGAVLHLDFSDEAVKKLVHLDDEYCSKINLMLKYISKNIISYMPYLPHSLTGNMKKMISSDRSSDSSSCGSVKVKKKRKMSNCSTLSSPPKPVRGVSIVPELSMCDRKTIEKCSFLNSFYTDVEKGTPFDNFYL